MYTFPCIRSYVTHRTMFILMGGELPKGMTHHKWRKCSVTVCKGWIHLHSRGECTVYSPARSGYSPLAHIVTNMIQS